MDARSSAFLNVGATVILRGALPDGGFWGAYRVTALSANAIHAGASSRVVFGVRVAARAATRLTALAEQGFPAGRRKVARGERVRSPDPPRRQSKHSSRRP